MYRFIYHKIGNVVSRKIDRARFFGNIKCATEKNSTAKKQWISDHVNMNTRKEFSLMTGDQRPVVYENSFSEEDNKEFMAALPQVVHDLSTATPLAKVPQCAERIADCLYYTARCGGNTRPLIFLYSYKKLERRENLTPENLRLACILAWCVKVLETHTVIFDDIVDESRYRYRGVCWHLRKDIGLSAIYDGELIEKVVYALLKKHFSSHPQYHNIVEFLQDTMLEIAIGQQLDSTNPGVDHLTMELFNHIVLRKGGHLFHYLPVVTAMRLANVDDPEIYQRAIPILLKMGSIFQMQDDYLDCYGDEIKLGKDFTDMRNGKTTWLVVTALEKSNANQRRQLLEYYGNPSEEAIKIIKGVYDEINLREEFLTFEQKTYQKIREDIEGLPKNLIYALIAELLEKQYEGKLI